MPEDDKPPERPTAKLDQTEILLRTIEKKMDDGFTRIGQNLDLVSGDVSVIRDRVTSVEGRVGALEGRTTTHSDRVRDVSQNDLAQEAKIAAEIMARQQLAQKVDTIDKNLTEVKAETKAQTATLLDIKAAGAAIAKHPLTQLIVLALSIFLTGYIAAHGGKP